LAGACYVYSPLVAVMFPKVVQSAVRNKNKRHIPYFSFNSNSRGYCSYILHTNMQIFGLYFTNPQQVNGFIPESILQKILSHQEVITSVGTMIPWFVWCMLPLSLANVLLNNLLARMEYRVVPYIVVLVAVYATVEITFGSSFIRVIQF
jgi:hypothetical protein